MEISHQQLDEILADFSCTGRAVYLDDPMLDLGHAATELDSLGIPEFSPDIPQLPVALFERHQALWTQPTDDTPRQEVWTEQALTHGMERIGYGVVPMPRLDGWALGEWPRDEGGLQLQQPDGTLFVYAPCQVDPAWITAAERTQWVLALHGPNLGLRVPPSENDADQQRKAVLAHERRQGMVTGGLMRWGPVRES